MFANVKIVCASKKIVCKDKFQLWESYMNDDRSKCFPDYLLKFNMQGFIAQYCLLMLIIFVDYVARPNVFFRQQN